jgi:hypothetical protein
MRGALWDNWVTSSMRGSAHRSMPEIDNGALSVWGDSAENVVL